MYRGACVWRVVLIVMRSEFQEICYFLRMCVREKFPDDEMVGVLNFFDRYICGALAKVCI